MKRLVVIVLIFWSFHSFGQTKDTILVQDDTVVLKRDTALRNELLNIDLKSFIGKPVAEFLKHPIIKLYKVYVFSIEPPGVLYSLLMEYARGLDIEVFVYPIKYQLNFSEFHQFSFELYKKKRLQP